MEVSVPTNGNRVCLKVTRCNILLSVCVILKLETGKLKGKKVEKEAQICKKQK